MNFRQLKGVITKSGKMNFPEHRNLARTFGADSMVLLKNNGILPMNKGKVALFGAGAVDTVFCGIFYNYVFTDGNINVKQGLINNGFTFSTDIWLDKMEKATKKAYKSSPNTKSTKLFAGMRTLAEEVPISVADLAEAIIGTDTCIYVTRRQQTFENSHDVSEKPYHLSQVEQENLSLITGAFKNVILVINSPMMEIASIARLKSVKAIVFMGIAGMEAGNALADVITGAVNPSGHLTNTWAKKYKDYSTCMHGSRKGKSYDAGEIDYKEGIYVGYRYFDAFDVAPQYPFGYGLSYTTFDTSLEYFEASWISIIMRVKVTNTGSVAGRHVVQVYCSQPEGEIEKPYQILCSFAKTGKLKPGESEELTLKIPIMTLTSFDNEDGAWVMEKGDYLFRIGDNSRDTKIAAKVVLDKRTVIMRVTISEKNAKPMEFLTPPPRMPVDTGYIKVASLSGDAYNSEKKIIEPFREVTTYVQEDSKYISYVNDNTYNIPYRVKENIEVVKPCGSATFIDVIKEKVSMEEFIASLSPEILARIVVGATEESKISSENRFTFSFNFDSKGVEIAAKTTNQFANTLGIPSVKIADGPSGLHLIGISCTCFPSPMNMAQTWDMSAMVRMGRAYGREMEAHDIDYCLAPALNISRKPMWNRAYEFYSEDPTISGVLGAGFIMGVKRYEGRNVIIKNLPVFNQDSSNQNVNINIERRTFGEIYLKPFSICQFVTKPAGILTSSLKINGRCISSNKVLNTDIIRRDWGFSGIVLSDWGSMSDKGEDVHAGCDLIMPGFDPDKLLESMMNVPPTFEEDGYVSVVEKAYLYGSPMIKYEKWGSFVLDKNGDTVVTAKVEPGNEVSERALKLQNKGLCTIKTEIDGTKTIIYKGFNRGPYLALGELQQAVINILNEIKNSGAMKKLMEQANI
ncbi:beta-glucosidase [Pseudobutyrivibrio sp. ACV-2]|uniref:glycoside hydrolase family 3 protein n=1 Tax=Pseudobutyrivibrio sp. ACV-2 TaxID=1520801 RepID=UPI000896A6F4|nr:glycoside hydrolase family 3 protein [Pseudobutyrivibrio sp. ACV-2]SEA04811.1 beta-glucosidase [Pseudobutyrivibrio sp. ACV-2]